MWRRDWFFGLLLGAAVLLAYQPAWQGTPIWDDDAHLTRPELRSWTGLARIWCEPTATQQYYPLVHSTFWVEYAFWGDSTFGYHLVNLLLHALSAFLLLKILQQLKIPGARLATLIFALHPVQVESVAWITELKNMLSGFFYFGSALAYLRFDRTRQRRLYVLAFSFFVLGLLSKTVIATLPAALLVIFWWERGKLDAKKDVLPLAPFFVVGTSCGLFTSWLEHKLIIGNVGSDYHFTMVERTLIAGRDIWFYLDKLIWPADLIFIYPRWDISETTGWQYMFPLAVVIVATGFWAVRRLWRGPLAGLLYFVGTLFPALGFINVFPFRYSFVADHFQYLACLGFIVPCAAGLTIAADRFKPLGKGTGTWLGLMTGGLLALLTWRQSGMYADIETLWQTTIARNPGCWMAYNNLGGTKIQEGEIDQGITYCQKSLEIEPNDAEAESNLGLAYAEKGMQDESKAHFQRAIAIRPAFADGYRNFGRILLQFGRVDAAIEKYRKAIELRPDDAMSHNCLCLALLQAGRYDESIRESEKTLELHPGVPEVENNLGLALYRAGRIDEAAAHFQNALAIQPHLAGAQASLGAIFYQKGQNVAAIDHFEKALALERGNPQFRYNLGLALFAAGRINESITQFQQAVATGLDTAAVHNNLGTALSRVGRTDEARTQFEATLTIDANDINARANLARLPAIQKAASAKK